MDHMKIVKKAFDITRVYKLLWVFGTILALTSAGGRGSSNIQIPFRGGANWTRPVPFPGDFDFPEDLDWIFTFISSQVASALIALGIGLICFVFLLGVISTIARYVSETALVRMIDNHESSGEKVTFNQGWKLGWSRTAFHIFLIDLLVGIITAVVFLILFGFALAPLLVWLIDNTVLRVIGTAASIGLGMLIFFLAILLGIIIGLLIHLIRRACILEKLGVFEAIRRGIELTRRHIVDVFFMGVILFVCGLVFVIVMIPVAIMLVTAGLILAGLPALLIGAVVGIFSDGPTPWIIAAIFSMPVFILIITIPLAFLGGLFETFRSCTWTLTYRELLAMEFDKMGDEMT